MRLETVTIYPEPFGSEAAQYLIGMLDNDLMHRYPGHSVSNTSSSEFEHDKSVFLIARHDGVPIACGGLVYVDEDTCEVRRMFTEPQSRGHGVAKMVLLKLEEHAADKGFRIIRLETGKHQPEAIIMYEHHGYNRISAFRHYEDNPHSHYYEKRIR